MFKIKILINTYTFGINVAAIEGRPPQGDQV